MDSDNLNGSDTSHTNGVDTSADDTNCDNYRNSNQGKNSNEKNNKNHVEALVDNENETNPSKPELFYID